MEMEQKEVSKIMRFLFKTICANVVFCANFWIWDKFHLNVVILFQTKNKRVQICAKKVI
jgi:hypothetical protein